MPAADDDLNPYATPNRDESARAAELARFADQFPPELAERWRRWLAAVIDNLLLLLASGFIGAALSIFLDPGAQLQSTGTLVVATVLAAAAIAVTALQLHQLATRAQTIGKRALGTRVVTASDRSKISGGAAGIRAAVFALPPIEIVPADGGFDYTAKYLLKSTQEICPGRFSPEISAVLMDHALRAHRALSCSGYSRSDFIVSAGGPVYLETNTLPGLTKASLYPKALKAEGIEFADFLRDQIELAERRVRQ